MSQLDAQDIKRYYQSLSILTAWSSKIPEHRSTGKSSVFSQICTVWPLLGSLSLWTWSPALSQKLLENFQMDLWRPFFIYLLLLWCPALKIPASSNRLNSDSCILSPAATPRMGSSPQAEYWTDGWSNLWVSCLSRITAQCFLLYSAPQNSQLICFVQFYGPLWQKG